MSKRNVNSSDIKAKLKKLHEEMDFQNHAGNLNRARSITVGTCFGGTTEIMMRGADGSVLWTPMQPVEIVELIHQLAGNIGCHINIQPRKDFSSWRDWRVTEQEKLHYNGFAPFVNDMAPFQNKGQILPPPEEQPGFTNGNLPSPEEQPGLNPEKEEEKPELMLERNKDESVATKKIVNKRSSK